VVAPIIYSAAFGSMLAIFAFYAARDDKPKRPRRKPFDDPGGYAAHGDWPFVPSDLKVSSFHDRKE
jgi:hypothetical protein